MLSPANDLILIQFTGSPTRQWLDILRTQGVEALRYVPDDTFIARVNGARPGDLRRLPFVRWVGRYRPEHKLQASLQDQHPVNPTASVEVAVLLAQGAPDGEVRDLKRLFENLRHETAGRVGTILRGQLGRGQLRKAAESPAVLWIEPAGQVRLHDEDSSRIIGGPGTNHQTFTQQYGLDGRGVRVAVADSGLHRGADGTHPDLAGRVVHFDFYPPMLNASDEHAHGTHVAGIIAGAGVLDDEDGKGRRFGVGVAPGAELVIQRIFDGGGALHAPDWPELSSDALQAGAVIGSNSWGEDAGGRYDSKAMVFDALVRDGDWTQDGDQPYCLIFSAGNSGPALQTISSPALAKNVIAVGASQSERKDYFSYTQGREALADFSSRGPCDDGRIKPDVVAPGTWIASLRSPLGSDLYAWQTIDDQYLFMGGTSQAAPHVSGAAAVFYQYYRERYGNGPPSPALVKAALIHSTRDSDNALGTGPTPNMGEGWGRADLTELIRSPRSHLFVDQSVLLRQDEFFETNVIIASSAEPLKVTMAYTDFPGMPMALRALVNDLDLELLAPDGRVYRGNQFEAGESVPNVPTSDAVNNVEGILVRRPPPGEYRVRVWARRVVQDSVKATPTADDQDFALVICGAIPFPDEGVLLMERSSYTAPGQINLRLFDVDLVGMNAPTVTVRSASSVVSTTLKPFGSYGWYTGAVVTTATFMNNQLLIHDGETIVAEFVDVFEETTNRATAMADLTAPTIHDVEVANQFGDVVIRWNTLEPATSFVRYGTSPQNLNRTSSSDLYTLSHQLALTNLVTGQNYYYEVISTDVAGNSGIYDTEDPFQAQPPASVLLVDAYKLFEGGDEFIPVSTYTNALHDAGVTYTEWNVQLRGMMPPLAVLRAHQAVIWRINDSQNQTEDMLPPQQRQDIEEYLNQGGAFFMASMQILNQLATQGDSQFLANVLHVGRFTQPIPPDSPCPECDQDFGVPAVADVPNEILGGGVSALLDYSHYPDPLFLGADKADVFGVSTNASAFLVDPASGRMCGMRFPQTGEESAGRVVFVGFPFDALPEAGAGPNSRSGFLQRVLQFLVPGLRGLGTIALDRSQYGLPDLLTIEVADSDLIGQPSVTVDVSSTSGAPVAARLFPTPRPGLFRGTLPMVSANPENPVVDGQLRAFDGDVIVAEYRELQDNALVTNQAIAIVDTIAPVITSLHFEPGYYEFTVTWETDEPADSLVLFGESAFMGRTAFSSAFDYSHRVVVTGLSPDRAYWFKVVSRDAGGNTTNAPVVTRDTLAPWQDYRDDLEADNTTNLWRVVNGPRTQVQWEWSSPQTVVAGAHSPVRAWASPRISQEASFIDTSLIGPALLIEGGNVATLQFWHAFNFSTQPSENEFGQLLVITNSLSPPVLLMEFRGTEPDWRLQEVDLTGYIDRPISLIWRHRLESPFPRDRQGWVLDDLNVTVADLPTGTIQVINNLHQANVTLSVAGAALRQLEGRNAIATNLPPGRYVATWSTVTNYLTPSPQTNVLAPNGTLQFTGTYVFPDINTNLISDLFELAVFGTIAPGSERTRFTDTDGDGYSDMAEFVAGTNPKDPASKLKLTATWSATPMQLELRWSTLTTRRYRIEASSNLTLWSPVSDWLSGNGAELSLRVMASGNTRAFRVEVQP